MSYLADRNPFDSCNVLMNINTGKVCSETAKVNIVNYIREGLIGSVKELFAFDFSFKKKGKVEANAHKFISYHRQ